MNQDINNYFDGFDFENAQPIKLALIKKIQDEYQQRLQK